jgi:hypothetical protein
MRIYRKEKRGPFPTRDRRFLIYCRTAAAVKRRRRSWLIWDILMCTKFGGIVDWTGDITTD